MREGELCGLRWSDLDLDAGKAHVVQQLLTPGPEPVFGPTKTGAQRTISLSAQTVALLRAHRRHQRELRLANGPRYRDLGLVFAKEWKDLVGQSEPLGLPLQANNWGSGRTPRLSRQPACLGLSSTDSGIRAQPCSSAPAIRPMSLPRGSDTPRCR